MRPIDANALLEHLARCIEQSKGLMRSVCVAIKCFVEQMPTVQAVPVVRCRECLHYRQRVCKLHSEEPDQYSCGHNVEMAPDGFCSEGERRKPDA